MSQAAACGSSSCPEFTEVAAFEASLRHVRIFDDKFRDLDWENRWALACGLKLATNHSPFPASDRANRLMTSHKNELRLYQNFQEPVDGRDGRKAVLQPPVSPSN